MFEFILGLLGIASSYLQQSKNKTAQTVGADIDLVDQATLQILKLNAQIKGAAVDWDNPTAVQAFLATLPTLTPIPDPAPDAPKTS